MGRRHMAELPVTAKYEEYSRAAAKVCRDDNSDMSIWTIFYPWDTLFDSNRTGYEILSIIFGLPDANQIPVNVR
jgi:hypothetical protein